MTAKQQFLQDLQTDRDYIQHKQNSIWKEFHQYEYAGYVCTASGTYRVATIQNDTSNLFLHLNFLDHDENI